MTLVRKEHLLDSWRTICDEVEYAFQPVVNTSSGRTVGFEALIRFWNGAGFDSIPHLFDRASEDGVIVEVNQMLLERAADAFTQGIAHLGSPAASDDTRLERLFFNLDNRVFLQEYGCRALLTSIRNAGLSTDNVTFEISEQNALPEQAYDAGQLPALRGLGIQVALDDFGAGYSGLQVLYQAGVDVVKMDRFFISGIDRDATKRIFVRNLVNMAHAMGIRVVAEGVEEPAEYYTCRDIGCDYIQGYLIGEPELDVAQLRSHYPIVDELAAEDRRRDRSDAAVLRDRLRRIPPIRQDEPVLEVLRRFRRDREASFLPVVNSHGEPVGVLREHDLKEYVYSPFGISLLMNRSYGSGLYRYVQRVPIASVYSRVDRILELATSDDVAEALIITENGKYLGCLDSRPLLQIIHERELSFARDQNPLSRLPGNTSIAEHLATAFRPTCRWHALVYFDFDSFKPFNDSYGFGVGDRVIQLFADILKTRSVAVGDFAAHIGGDDFFLALERDEAALARVVHDVRGIVSQFTDDVRGVYDQRDVRRGYIEAMDRDGTNRRFDLLTASAAVLMIPPHAASLSMLELAREISLIKRRAKASSDGIVVASWVPRRLPDGCDGDYD